ncbi:hypothetical protein [Streptomyces albipurpureus]|uniref:Holin n=1 Tax=Streptomyces albipurpureus TaxID=2897419 RepID=A0ABT0UNL6_9ACTN|nr:hypothetical protein [Streptomyces sp. CWNU-1]MCM2390207.1 hypothetical protein [Streptomyces sp. CWNU-1]
MKNKTFQILVFAICVAGYIALAIAGQATAEYMTLVGPVLAAAYLTTHLGQQDQALDEIKENTNGVLTKRIETAVKNALAMDRQRPGP